MGALLIPALVVGGAFAAGSTMNQGGGKIKMPSATASSGNVQKTAAPAKQLSEQEKVNKKLAASLLTKDWGSPKLGVKGLLGL